MSIRYIRDNETDGEICDVLDAFVSSDGTVPKRTLTDYLLALLIVEVRRSSVDLPLDHESGAVRVRVER